MIKVETFIKFMRVFYEGCCISEIRKDSKLSYATAYIVSGYLNKKGFIKSYKAGRNVILKLTDKGQHFYNVIMEVDALLRQK